MRRRSPAVTALMAVIALVLLPAISNVEANALPRSWTPHLWIAWPAGLLLAVPLVYLEIRRHHSPGLVSQPDADSTGERPWLDRAVTDLATAVKRQWTDELARRSVRRDTPLRVRWQNTSRRVARHVADVVREDLPDRAMELSGDTAEQLVGLLDSLRDGQAVVLGEPGAGKTVLAVQFALRVLEHRRTGDPVPVLLNLSSWDPATEDLNMWLARRIVEDYPALGNEQVYGVHATRAVVADGLVLAVLDGLDEMPASAWPSAIAALDRAAGNGFPMVVTCRSQEYEDAVTTHGEFLRRAVVLEMQPVDLADARQYLIAAAPADASPWPPALDELEAQPDAPLAQVLASPLMIAMARTVYAAPASSPRELLSRIRFGKREQIEHHLLDEFVQSAYRDTPVIPGTKPPSRYPPQQAREWLAFLARRMRDQQTRDLAWWRMLDSEPRVSRALAAGVSIGLVFGVADVLVVGVAIGAVLGLAKVLAIGAASAVVDGLIAALIAGFGHPRPLTRAQLRFRRSTRPFLSRFGASCSVGVVVALTAGMSASPAVGLGLVIGLTFAAQVWLEAPTDATETPTPGIALRQSRTAALGFGLTLAVAFGVFETMNFLLGATQSLATASPVRLLVIVLLAVVVGACAGHVLYGWVGCIILGVLEAAQCGYFLAGSISGRLLGVAWFPLSGLHILHNGTVDVSLGITCGIVLGLVGVISRAWGSFCLVRIWLALRGRLPWRLMRFLEDAHRRGVLRQSGAVYQFRHARLQDQLASAKARDTQTASGPVAAVRSGSPTRTAS